MKAKSPEGKQHLYEKYIRPNEADLVSRILGYRRKVDELFAIQAREDFLENPDRELSHKGTKDIRRYPGGFCLDIRDKVLEMLNTDAPLYLRQFKNAKGILDSDWMIYDGDEKGFTNIIRVGNTIVDTANEELTGSTIPISLHHSTDSTYSTYTPLELDTYTEVTNVYWEAKVYASTQLLGKMSAFFPTIKIAVDGQMYIGPATEWIEITKNNGTKKAESWIKNLPPEQYNLPSEVLENLREAVCICLVSDTAENFMIPIIKNSAPHSEFMDFIKKIDKNLTTSISPDRVFNTKNMRKIRNMEPRVIEYSMMYTQIRYIQRFMTIYNTYIYNKSQEK